MPGVVIAIVILVILVVIRVLAKASNEDRAARQVQQRIRQAVEEGLTVRCTDDFYQPGEGGPRLPLKKIAVSGSIVMPAANQPVRFRVRLRDVTDSVAKPHPVFCMISDLADENGIYTFDQDTRIPYQFSEVRDMTLTTLPLFALLAPRQGPRRIHVTVAVTPVHRLDPVFAGGTAMFTFTQERPGYIEIGERTKARERQIATLALAMSAADGSIDRRESMVIRRFFTERYADREDGAPLGGNAIQLRMEAVEAREDSPSWRAFKLGIVRAYRDATRTLRNGRWGT